MFRITAETCRKFSFAEVLIMAAMNLNTRRPVSRTVSQQKPL